MADDWERYTAQSFVYLLDMAWDEYQIHKDTEQTSSVNAIYLLQPGDSQNDYVAQVRLHLRLCYQAYLQLLMHKSRGFGALMSGIKEHVRRWKKCLGYSLL